jgi:hypothetical protein
VPRGRVLTPGAGENPRKTHLCMHALSIKILVVHCRQMAFTVPECGFGSSRMLHCWSCMPGLSAVLCCVCCQADAVPGIILMLWTLTVAMKLISYAHCHTDLRTAHRRHLVRPGQRGAPGGGHINIGHLVCQSYDAHGCTEDARLCE